ncbi:hypothetical protein GCM10007304_30840 [Rhodococcoides trifolii]|uniref:Uncharacterized protein n=1 Tax=Rhodococcoides trifolii TaxID=908250 RepID=A0A917FYX9_9NOCA|nr:hypothetical protein GCM10007304_30840 [Rhodococcus trifolii]
MRFVAAQLDFDGTSASSAAKEAADWPDSAACTPLDTLYPAEVNLADRGIEVGSLIEFRIRNETQ